MNVEAYNAGYQMMSGMIGIVIIGLGVVGPALFIIMIGDILSLFSEATDE